MNFFISLILLLPVLALAQDPEAPGAESLRSIDRNDPVAVEERINELILQLNELRRKAEPVEVEDYKFRTSEGETSLSELFGDDSQLLVIHNMGKRCTYCMLYADGIHGFLPHLESNLGVVLVTGEEPEVQAKFAASRGWKFRLASHKELPYGEVADENAAGAVVYEKKEGKIFMKNECGFFQDDLYGAVWSFLGLAGISPDDWSPEYEYPEKVGVGE